jgi:hypothetical protein
VTAARVRTNSTAQPSFDAVTNRASARGTSRVFFIRYLVSALPGTNSALDRSPRPPLGRPSEDRGYPGLDARSSRFRRLVFGPAALAIVIFDAKQHAATGGSRHAPDIQRVHHVTKMQIPSRGGRKPRQHETSAPRVAWATSATRLTASDRLKYRSIRRFDRSTAKRRRAAPRTRILK